MGFFDDFADFISDFAEFTTRATDPTGVFGSRQGKEATRLGTRSILQPISTSADFLSGEGARRDERRQDVLASDEKAARQALIDAENLQKEREDIAASLGIRGIRRSATARAPFGTSTRAKPAPSAKATSTGTRLATRATSQLGTGKDFLGL